MSVIIRGMGGASGGSNGQYLGGTDLSSSATTSDEYAENKVISKATSSSAATTLFENTVKDIKLGTYAVMVRLKSSNITSTNNLVNVKAYLNSSSGTKLGEVNIKANMFDAANKYQTFGFIVNLNDKKGSNLYLNASLPKNATSITVAVDYVQIFPAFCSVSSL